jgi:hypothetical protein
MANFPLILLVTSQARVKVKRLNDNVAMSYVHLHCKISGDVKVYHKSSKSESKKSE